MSSRFSFFKKTSLTRSLPLALALLLLFSLCACKSDSLPTEPLQSESQESLESIPATTRPPVTETEASESLPPPPPPSSLLFPDRYPIAFMINNTAEARPQSGLSKAKLIYQMLTEGRTTRLLLLTDAPEGVIGPVRSARPAYLDLVAQHQAFYAYAGNYKVIKPSPVVDDIRILDALKGDFDIYYRTSHRQAPHNLYTTLEKAYQRAEKRYESLYFDRESQDLRAYEDFQMPPGGEEVRNLAYRFSGLKESFVYQPDIQAYYKYNNDQVLVDEQTGEILEISNILVIHRPHSFMPNGIHNKIDWLVEDQADYLTGGKKWEVNWEKKGHKDPIVYQLEGEDLILNPGLTWILVLDDQALKTVTYE